MFSLGAPRSGGTARIVRIGRLLRGSTEAILDLVFEKPPESAFLAATLGSLLPAVFSSITIPHFEVSVDEAKLEAAADASCEAVATTAMVGYHDRFPVTSDGPVLAGALMAAGVGVSATFTGFVASWFCSFARSAQGTESERGPTDAASSIATSSRK